MMQLSLRFATIIIVFMGHFSPIKHAFRVTFAEAYRSHIAPHTSSALDSAVTMHAKKLPILRCEMYNTRNDMNPSFIDEISCENTNCYNLRNMYA